MKFVDKRFWNKALAWASARPVDWRYAVRISLSALLSFALAEACGIPAPYWAVITAVIVARANVGGALRAGADRMLATLAGAGLGLLAALARPLGLPEFALLAGVVVPLALLAAARPQFRAALIAGLIVLEAHAGSGAPVGAALWRVGNIALGGLTAILVSRFVLPSHAARASLQHAADALKSLSALLTLVAQPAGTRSRAEAERLSAQARRAWRAAGRTAWEARAEPKTARDPGPAPHNVVRQLARMHSDVGLVARTLRHAQAGMASAEMPGALLPVAAAFAGVAEAAGRSLVHGEPTPRIAALDAALMDLPRGEQVPGAAALIDSLHVLRGDVAEFLVLLGRAPPGAAA